MFFNHIESNSFRDGDFIGFYNTFRVILYQAAHNYHHKKKQSSGSVALSYSRFHFVNYHQQFIVLLSKLQHCCLK
ncbi:hypothetical protein CMT41_18065 [Colwellia sp. MT41]|nr:hypothetical protein CMT41_18065 [Colwellia sp. MT41]